MKHISLLILVILSLGAASSAWAEFTYETIHIPDDEDGRDIIVQRKKDIPDFEAMRAERAKKLYKAPAQPQLWTKPLPRYQSSQIQRYMKGPRLEQAVVPRITPVH